VVIYTAPGTQPMVKVVRPPPLTLRNTLLLLAAVWMVGGVLFALSWMTTGTEKRMFSAPTCSPDQLSTSAECQVTLPGTVLELTAFQVEVDLGDRRVSMPVRLAGDVSGRGGTPVEVTFYRGQPVRVVGPWLKLDSTDSPATSAFDLREAGIGCLFVGTVVFGSGYLLRNLGALRPPRGGAGSQGGRSGPG